jgi:hypothetical protein
MAEPEVSNLTGAYIEVLLPNSDKAGGSEHERAVQAVRQRLQHESTKVAGAS